MQIHIFVDLEMNQVAAEDRARSGLVKNEIIQIGAVKLDENFRVLDTYEGFVKPAYSQICGICSRLTGITQQQVEKAPLLPEAVALFLTWVDAPQAAYYSWSDNDSRQLRHELRQKGASDDAVAAFSHWIDFQDVYGKLIGQGRMGLDVALKGAGLSHIGSKHSAMADALSSAQLLKLVHTPRLFEADKRERIVANTALVRGQITKRRQASRAKQAQYEARIAAQRKESKPQMQKNPKQEAK